MNIDEAILSRKSVRRFLSTPVPEETVRHILEVSARAPSGSNIQPWKVYAVAGEARARLCAEILRAAETEPDQHVPEFGYNPTEWPEPYLSRRRKLGLELYSLLGIARGDREARQRQMNRNYVFFDAPVGLLVTMDRRLNTGSVVDMGMFVQNILLAARGQGLHTCAHAAFTPYHDIIRKHLPLTGNEMLICGISLGHEDTSAPENRLASERIPVDEFAHFFGFQEKSS